METWEPLKHLQGCKDSINAYETRVKSKGVGKAKLATHTDRPSANPSPETTTVQYLMTKYGCDGSVSDWMQGYQHELNEVERRRLTLLTPHEVSKYNVKRRAVPLVMRLDKKKDGRRKGRLVLQGFRESKDLDKGAIDAPVAAIATVYVQCCLWQAWQEMLLAL